MRTDGRASCRPSLGLALGGGGARGFAHVAVLEALDELGIRPAGISGTSVGAVLGAVYAAGLSGTAIRRGILKVAHGRADTLARIVAARAAGLSTLFASPFGNPMLLDAEKVCDAFLPSQVPADFSELQIPLTVLATDYHGRRAVAFSSGPLRAAIAASMAVPGLVRPVVLHGSVLLDGAAVDPLPFEYLRETADVILAVDVSGGLRGHQGEVPDAWECVFSTFQIMAHTILEEKLRRGRPDVLVRPNVGSFRMLDFFRASAIMRAADPIKSEVKRQLAAWQLV